jgi:hypothetical protein
MRLSLLALLLCVVSCSSGDLHAEMADLRAEIEQLQRDVPPEAPLWVTEGESAFPKFLDDYTSRVPDFIYNHILGKLAKGTGAEIDAMAKGDFNYDACFKDPDAMRGKFLHVRGLVGVLKAQPCDPASGLREVHAGLAWDERRPILFHVVEKPEILFLHQDLVEFSGIFLKILRYTTKEGTVVDAPFFLAKIVRKYY